MALSEAERAQIRKYLGYTTRFRNLDTALESAMSNIANVPDDENELRVELARCVRVDKQLDDYILKLALVIDTGSIKMRAAYSLAVIRNVGRQAVGRIAGALGVRVRNDAFSSGGPASEDVSAGLGQPPESSCG